ncbi:hypothetical protein TGAMA5MH_02415 [Trichoderma gamsii]|uniref:Uncharacterized protein n=1 Tax=Trichoderma gamsii TaxID=398673 RepID=A0A2K0TLH2_9HYPO|nr:hypothetical protein TGAMA5MH_02415 [Trichoderma gamsii]
MSLYAAATRDRDFDYGDEEEEEQEKLSRQGSGRQPLVKEHMEVEENHHEKAHDEINSKAAKKRGTTWK